MIAKDSVSAKELRDRVQEISQAHFPCAADGYKCTTELLYAVLLKAAAEGISMEAACTDLDAVVDSHPIRAHLNAHLDVEQRRDHAQEINGALAFGLPHHQIAHLRDDLPAYLARLGTQEGCEQLRYIQETVGVNLNHWIHQAEGQMRHNTWQPPSPKQLREMLKNQQMQRIQSGSQLLDVIIQVLDKLNDELQCGDETAVA